jgi:hypothetical protein
MGSAALYLFSLALPSSMYYNVYEFKRKRQKYNVVVCVMSTELKFKLKFKGKKFPSLGKNRLKKCWKYRHIV